jgi:uncharacterized membrane protein
VAEETPLEGRAGVARVEAFSDGVIAIIITVMVLELHAPQQDGFSALWRLWPTYLSYVLSYAYVAIYWVNHHRLFGHARIVSNGLLWSNIALLFALSLVPFTTANLGKHGFSQTATMLYLWSLLNPAIAYFWLQTVIRRTGSQSELSRTYQHSMTRKGIASVLIYASAIPLSLISPLIGVALAGLVAVLWMLPWSPLDQLFLRREK